MERIATGTRMRAIDAFTIQNGIVPGDVLMERAGEGLTRHLLEIIEENSLTRCLIVAGAGNNGGDGYVAARLLKQQGIEPRVYSTADPAKLKGDALLNFNRWIALRGEVRCLKEEGVMEDFRRDCRQAELIVDAILGTGIDREVGGTAKEVIEEINEAAPHAVIVAVDIPSGVGADDGRVYGTAVRADQTVTFQMNKFGCAAEPGRSRAGIVHVEDIGLSRELCEQDEGVLYRMDPQDAAALLPERRPDMNKGSAGKLLILAGSKGMAGAAVLAAKAAYRSGAGLVKVAAPWEVVQVLQTAVPEATTLILGNDPEESFRGIEEEMKQYDALAVGPGLGKAPETAELVRKLLKEIEKPIVLDADGINLAAKDPEMVKGRKAPLVLTPHPGEMGRLMGRTPEEVNRDRLKTVTEFTKAFPAVLLLKGAGTLIQGSGEEARTWLNPTGNPGMATAGSGDVLTGVIGAFLAAGLTAEHSAVLGAYVHGMAGDLAAETIGEYGLMAGDIADHVSLALKELSENPSLCSG